MYAIIKTGGKQYRVKEDDVIDVELLETEKGAQIEFPEVIFFFDGKNSKVGSPTVSGCIVKGEILGQVAGPKVKSMKYRPSHNQRRKFGHKQKYNRVKITAIGGREGKKHKA